MTSPNITLLNGDHDLSQFNSGAAELDSWLRGHALTAQQRDTSRIYVIADHNNAVYGYLAMVVGVVASRELPSRARSGLPSDVPAVLLGNWPLIKNTRAKVWELPFCRTLLRSPFKFEHWPLPGSC